MGYYSNFKIEVKKTDLAREKNCNQVIREVFEKYFGEGDSFDTEYSDSNADLYSCAYLNDLWYAFAEDLTQTSKENPGFLIVGIRVGKDIGDIVKFVAKNGAVTKYLSKTVFDDGTVFEPWW